MSLQGFINLLAIILAFVASLFFCFGSAEMKTKEIKKLAGTYWGSNPHLRKFLISLKADYLCGAITLCIAFFLQFLANIPGVIPSQIEFISIFRGTCLAVLVGGSTGVLLFIFRCLLARHINKHFSQPSPE